MPLPLHLAIAILAAGMASAGTVVITSLPDEDHPLQPLGTLDGTALSGASEIQVGAFPGMDADELLDAAASGGFAGLSAAFVSFGDSYGMGDGALGENGSFEISVRQKLEASGSPLAGEEISLLIKQGNEFLVARFPSQLFEADPETGLEPLKALHLADSKLIVGNRYGSTKLVTSPPPTKGSFNTWIEGFQGITDPALKLRDADADGDGRSNFLEYATGGDPASPTDPAPCQIFADGDSRWVKFCREAGVGTIDYTVKFSASLSASWSTMDGDFEPDPDPPVAGDLNWMRLRVSPTADPHRFFRLEVKPDEAP